MSNRRKLSPPLPYTPEALQVEVSVERIDLDMNEAETKVSQYLSRRAASLMESVMDELRLQGVSEQQIADFLYAARVVCVEKLWGMDLDSALFEALMEGRRPNLRAMMALALLPELNELRNAEWPT
jgi:hypothetical protein